MTLFRCIACGNITEQDDLLQAPNPFDSDRVLTGCPECRSVWDEAGEALCDEPGCERPSNCGWPTKNGGYRRTCYQHMAEGYAHNSNSPTFTGRIVQP